MYIVAAATVLPNTPTDVSTGFQGNAAAALIDNQCNYPITVLVTGGNQSIWVPASSSRLIDLSLSNYAGSFTMSGTLLTGQAVVTSTVLVTVFQPGDPLPRIADGGAPSSSGASAPTAPLLNGGTVAYVNAAGAATSQTLYTLDFPGVFDADNFSAAGEVYAAPGVAQALPLTLLDIMGQPLYLSPVAASYATLAGNIQMPANIEPFTLAPKRLVMLQDYGDMIVCLHNTAPGATHDLIHVFIEPTEIFTIDFNAGLVKLNATTILTITQAYVCLRIKAVGAKGSNQTTVYYNATQGAAAISTPPALSSNVVTAYAPALTPALAWNDATFPDGKAVLTGGGPGGLAYQVNG